MTEKKDKRVAKTGILAQVVVAGLSFGSGLPDREVTSGYEINLVLEAIDSIEDDRKTSAVTAAIQLRALRLLSTDPRPTVRAAVAYRGGVSAASESREIERVIASLAGDPVPAVQRSLARGLADGLEGLDPLGRINRVCSLATSPEIGLRLAAALVLAEPVDVLGATSCLEQLARDSAVEVRRAIAVAARDRRDSAPARCDAILEQLSRDGDEDVADAARRGLAT